MNIDLAILALLGDGLDSPTMIADALLKQGFPHGRGHLGMRQHCQYRLRVLVGKREAIHIGRGSYALPLLKRIKHKADKWLRN
jgi:hypothetical protein